MTCGGWPNETRCDATSGPKVWSLVQCGRPSVACRLRASDAATGDTRRPRQTLSHARDRVCNGMQVLCRRPFSFLRCITVMQGADGGWRSLLRLLALA